MRFRVTDRLDMYFLSKTFLSIYLFYSVYYKNIKVQN